MFIAKRCAPFAFTALLGLGLVDAPAHAATSGSNDTHDPSRIIESDGRFTVHTQA